MSAQKSSRGPRSTGDARVRQGSRSSRTSTGSQSNATKTPAASDRRGFAEQLVNRIIDPLGLLLLTRERIQEVLDEAAARGRITRSDANDLVTELVNRGRQQTDDLLKDVEGLVGRGRDQVGSVTRRAVGIGYSLPISDYDDLTAGQVGERLAGLTPSELRKVREYERRHANRKSVLAAIEKSLG